MAERIPGAHFVTLPRGGHVLTLIDPAARRAVAEFLDAANAPAPIPALAPWLSGLAVWESSWRTPRARRVLVLIVAVAFIVLWAAPTFTSRGGG